MPRKTLATGAAAALLTGAVFLPVIVRQHGKIAELELQLAATKAPADPAAANASGTPGAVRPADSRPSPQRVPTRRSEYEEQQARYEPVKDKVTAWKDAAMQMDDAGRKQQALDEILVALSSADDEEVFAALTGYGSVSQVEFDRSAFRPAIVKLLDGSGELCSQCVVVHPIGPNEFLAPESNFATNGGPIHRRSGLVESTQRRLPRCNHV